MFARSIGGSCSTTTITAGGIHHVSRIVLDVIATLNLLARVVNLMALNLANALGGVHPKCQSLLEDLVLLVATSSTKASRRRKEIFR
jgi:hypothetical protein